MKPLLIIILLICTQQQMQSQSIYLNDLNGNVSEYDISSVRKLQFSSSEVLTILFNGDTIKRPFNEFKNYRYNNQNSLSNVGYVRNFDALNVYPNPTEDQVGFNFVSKSLMPYNYSVSDITGKVLFKKELGMIDGYYSGSISLARYSTGTYLLVLNNGKSKITKKIIKK